MHGKSFMALFLKVTHLPTRGEKEAFDDRNIV
jgi:hypothetical protein